MNESKIQKATRDFAIEGFKRIGEILQNDDIHPHVLKNKYDNFIGKFKKHPPDFKLHRWAGSVTSSQAFAYNIFSGIKGVQFEYPMKAHNRDAQMDVMLEDNDTVHLYEVKFTEFTKSQKILFEDKYYNENNYKFDNDTTRKYIDFIKKVEFFNEQIIHAYGIKQLCSHLLGILNSMELFDKKKVKLYSLCFDYPISPEFTCFVENYKDALEQFKNQYVDSFLQKINLNNMVEYCGFLSATDYIEKNEELIGKENYNYVKKRYLL